MAVYPSMSSDDDASAEQPTPGWLGNVRSWVGTGAREPEPAAAPPVNLSTEEIRRRRLEKMEGARSAQVCIERFCGMCGVWPVLRTIVLYNTCTLRFKF